MFEHICLCRTSRSEPSVPDQWVKRGLRLIMWSIGHQVTQSVSTGWHGRYKHTENQFWPSARQLSGRHSDVSRNVSRCKYKLHTQAFILMELSFRDGVKIWTSANECVTFHPPPDHRLVSRGGAEWLRVIKTDGPPVAHTHTRTACWETALWKTWSRKYVFDQQTEWEGGSGS